MNRSRTIVVSAPFALVAAVVATPAPAQEARPLISGDLSPGGRAGVEILVADMYDDVTVATVDAVVDASVSDVFKIHARLPFGHFDVDGGDSASGMGNATVGGRFLTVGSDVQFGLGVSVSLATASDEGEERDAAIAAANLHRLHDPGRYLPDTATVRAEGDLVVPGDRGFFHVGLGVHHLMFDRDDLFEGGDDDLDLLRLNVGGGFYLNPSLALVGELSNMSDFFEDDDDDDFEHAADVGLQLNTGGLTASFRVYLPVEEEDRYETDAVAVGVDLFGRF